MSAIIKYFIPEDRDVEDKPNAFIIYKDQDKIRLTDLIEHFPIPGEYVFRFKTTYEKKNIWIDFYDEMSPLPTIDGKIIIKVNRISWQKNNDKEVKQANSYNPSDFPEFI